MKYSSSISYISDIYYCANTLIFEIKWDKKKKKDVTAVTVNILVQYIL